jgi:hypothetical protein
LYAQLAASTSASSAGQTGYDQQIVSFPGGSFVASASTSVDLVNFYNSAANTTSSGDTSMSLRVAPDLVYTAIAWNASPGAVTPATGFTLTSGSPAQAGSGNYGAAFYGFTAATGTVNPYVTWVTSRAFAQISVGFFPLATGAFSGSYTGSGSATIQETGSFSGAYTGSGTATVSVPATGSFSGSYTGSGSATIQETGSFSGSYTGSGTATVSLAATGSFSASYTGSGSATLQATGTFSGSYTGSGTASVSYAASGEFDGSYTGSGAATLSATGEFDGTYTGSGTAVQTYAANGEFDGAYSGNGSATLSFDTTGSFTASYTGSATAYLSATGEFDGTYSGSGTATTTEGATGSFSASYTGSGTAVLSASGTFSGSYTGSGTAVAATVATGSFTGSYTGTGTSYKLIPWYEISTYAISNPGVCVTPDGTKVYVAQTSSNPWVVVELDPITLTKLATVLSSSTSNVYFPVANNTYLYVPYSTYVDQISTSTNAVVNNWNVGHQLFYLTLSSDGSELYGLGSTVVTFTNTLSGSTTTITPGYALTNFKLSPDGTRLAIYGASSASIINTSTQSVVATISGTSFIGVTADNTSFYFADQGASNVQVVTQSSGAVSSTIALTYAPGSIAMLSNYSEFYTSNTSHGITPIPTATLTPGTLISGSYNQLSVTPEGNYLLATEGGIAGISPTTNTQVRTSTNVSSSASLVPNPTQQVVYGNQGSSTVFAMWLDYAYFGSFTGNYSGSATATAVSTLQIVMIV